MPCYIYPNCKQGNRIERLNLFFVLFFGLLVVGCQPKGPQQVLSVADYKPLLAQADSLRTPGPQQNIPEALALYRSLVPVTRACDSITDWLLVCRKVADILDANLKQHDAALLFIDSTYEAMKTWRMPEKDEELKMLARLYNRDISTSRDQGNLYRLKAVLERAETLHKTTLWGKAHGLTGYFLGEMAAYQIRIGDFDNANNYFRQCVEYEATYNRTGITDYNNYGDLYLSMGDYETANTLFDKGLALADDYFIRTILMLNKSEVLAHLNYLAAAEEWNRNGFKRLVKDSFDNNKDYTICYVGYLENNAIMLEKQGKWADARAFYNQILAPEILSELGRRNIAGYYTNLANTWYQEKNYSKALEQYHAAYLKFYPDAANNLSALPEANTMPADKILANILEGKARCFAGLEQYDQSLLAYQLIPEIEAQLRASHAFEKSILMALQKSRQRFDDAVDLAWIAWQKTKDPKYAAQAFQFTERARGTLQTKGINANEARALLLDGQQEQDKTLSDNIALAETRLSEADEANKISALMQEIRTLRNQQKQSRAEFAAKNYAYAAALGNDAVLSIRQVGALLRPGQTMLDHYITKDTNLYTFSFDAAGNAAWMHSNWSVIDKNSTDSLLQMLRRNPVEGDIVAFRKNAWTIGQKLLALPQQICLGRTAPLLESTLVLVPDLYLAALPYEVLLTAPSEATDWAVVPFAVQRHAMSYAYSASLLALQKTLTEKRSSRARIPFAGFAPSYSNGADLLDNAADDVQFGATLFGGKPFVGVEASEIQFKKTAEQAQILLLSMHGISDHAHPNRSHLRFGDPAEGQDNVLYASELQSIPCRADLAVMSACFTGDGPVQLGEGVYSMARSFAISGVPATAMSIWKFPVKSSTYLVRDFLTGIKNQTTKDAALQLAKQNWLKANIGSKFAHPYFWAGLVTAGDSTAIQLNSGKFWWWMAAAGIGLLALFIYFFKRK